MSDNSLLRKSDARVGQYDLYVKPYLPQITKWTAEGMNLATVSDKLGVKLSYLKVMVSRNEEFAIALEMGRELMKEDMEIALYNKANGYDYTEIEETTQHDEFGDPVGKTKVKRTTKTMHADTNALQFVLKNLDPDKWKDKQQIEVDGSLELAERANEYEAYFEEIEVKDSE